MAGQKLIRISQKSKHRMLQAKQDLIVISWLFFMSLQWHPKSFCLITWFILSLLFCSVSYLLLHVLKNKKNPHDYQRDINFVSCNVSLKIKKGCHQRFGVLQVLQKVRNGNSTKCCIIGWAKKQTKCLFVTLILVFWRNVRKEQLRHCIEYPKTIWLKDDNNYL